MSGNNKDPWEGFSNQVSPKVDLTLESLERTIDALKQVPSPYLCSDTEWTLDPKDAPSIPTFFYRCREYTPHDPWLVVRFLDGEGAMVGVFYHPGGLVPPGSDYMVMPGKFIAPSAQLLKALKAVIDG
jgi:hypothetical protein